MVGFSRAFSRTDPRLLSSAPPTIFHDTQSRFERGCKNLAHAGHRRRAVRVGRCVQFSLLRQPARGRMRAVTRESLSRAAVVEAARELLTSEGLSALSLRRLAAKL